METNLSTFTNFYNFTTGRKIFALGKIVEAIDRLDDDSFTPIAQHAATAVEHSRATLRLEKAFRMGRTRIKEAPSVAELDVKLDRAIVALRDGIRVHVDPDVDEIDGGSRLARRLLHACFPDGVLDIIHSPFVEQLAKVDEMLERIAVDHMEAIELLGLERLLARVVRMNDAYRAAQAVDPERDVEYASVQASRARGQELLLEVIVMILGRFPHHNAAHAAGREALLWPVVAQNEAIGLALRSRRGTIEDVDPDTGEPVTSEPTVASPAPTPATEEAVATD